VSCRIIIVLCLLVRLCPAAQLPKPRVPADNPLTPAKAELGRYLFYDTRMSVNGKQSCATCHRQELAFTDGRPVAMGATGQNHPRGAMSLVNVAYNSLLTWNNPQTRELEQQALVPMFGEHPIELGLRPDSQFFTIIRSDATYKPLFEKAFPSNADPFTISNITKAIACFERTIISARSPWDRYHYNRDETAISESAKHGEVLFFSQPLSCFRCHGGFNFSDNTMSANSQPEEPEFHNTGLKNQQGKFKAPTLRNIAVTAPYMHDGSLPTLDAVLDHYASGGHNNPDKDPLIHGFNLTPDDKKDLIEFLKALTDEAVLHDPSFANPWH